MVALLTSTGSSIANWQRSMLYKTKVAVAENKKDFFRNHVNSVDGLPFRQIDDPFNVKYMFE